MLRLVPALSSTTTHSDGVADVVENEDVALLKRLVLNERGAPEILPYNERVVDELLAIVRNQQEKVEELRVDVDEALEGNLVSLLAQVISRAFSVSLIRQSKLPLRNLLSLSVSNGARPY